MCVGEGWDLIRVIATCCMSKGFFITQLRQIDREIFVECVGVNVLFC